MSLTWLTDKRFGYRAAGMTLIPSSLPFQHFVFRPPAAAANQTLPASLLPLHSKETSTTLDGVHSPGPRYKKWSQV